MMIKPLVVTVSQLNRKLALMVEAEKTFENLCIRGEISSLTCHSSGHIYFTLKDEACSIRAVMFSSYARKLKEIPEIGAQVTVVGNVCCYERDGSCQIKATDILKDGEGAAAVSAEQLKEKLKSEGIFDNHRPIPKYPEKICVITSETGAALQDILNILGRRYPVAAVLLIPSLVQGDEAPASLAAALKKAAETDSDVIIFGRGGGSAEDLSPFNTEVVARAVHGSPIPVISAVGHETDFTLSDMAADLRAPTPSAAAELVAPDIAEIKNGLLWFKNQIFSKVTRCISDKELHLKLINSRIQAVSPAERLKAEEREISAVYEKIRNSAQAVIAKKNGDLRRTAAVIEALNPLAVLMRGYSITYKDGKALVNTDGISKGDKITIRLQGGEMTAAVEEVRKDS